MALTEPFEQEAAVLICVLHQLAVHLKELLVVQEAVVAGAFAELSLEALPAALFGLSGSVVAAQAS